MRFDSKITKVKIIIILLYFTLAGLTCDRHTSALAVAQAGCTWGLEEGCESRKFGDDNLAPQLNQTLAVGTIQHF